MPHSLDTSHNNKADNIYKLIYQCILKINIDKKDQNEKYPHQILYLVHYYAKNIQKNLFEENVRGGFLPLYLVSICKKYSKQELPRYSFP